MAHRRFTHLFRRRSPTARSFAAAVAFGLPRLLHAQATNPSTLGPTPTVAPYRIPTIALVQPVSGGSVPQDKPVAVFRFAQGESTDAIDAKSLKVSIDGVDVTPAFQIAGGDAWGSLAGIPATFPAPGLHQVFARICSERGACGDVSAVLVVAATTHQPDAAPSMTKRGRLVDLVMKATRKLLLP